MIKRIELTNFMSHEHTVIEPAAGLTVLVGPNNCGKSAVVAALQILAYNESSKYVVRHGEKECSVRLETDDGHVIEWRRKRDSPRYTIDGELFDRLGRGGTPDALAKTLRLARVSAGDRETDVHFGDQKRPIFLLDASELQAAQFFASSSDASRFVQMQTLHKQKAAHAQRDKVRLEAESAQLNRELEALEPLAPIDEQLRELEQAHTELCDLANCIDEQTAHLARMGAKAALLARHQAESRALAALPSPPEMLPVGPLGEVVDRLQKLRGSVQKSTARAAALSGLVAPPDLPALEPLEKLLAGLTSADVAHREAAAVTQCLAALHDPPPLHDVAELKRTVQGLLNLERQSHRWGHEQQALASLNVPPPLAPSGTSAASLEDLVARMKSAAARAAAAQEQQAAAQANLQEAEARIGQWAAQGQVCSACGSPIDPQRLLARIARLEEATI